MYYAVILIHYSKKIYKQFSKAHTRFCYELRERGMYENAITYAYSNEIYQITQER